MKQLLNFQKLQDVLYKQFYIPTMMGDDTMRNKYIQIRCSEQERQEIIEAAQKQRLPVSQFLRQLVWEKMKGSEK